MSDYKVMRAAEAAFAMVSVKVTDHSTESHGHEDFWPIAHG
jgi:hypothetical protein